MGSWGLWRQREEEDKKRGLKKKRNKWVLHKGHKSLFTLLFNTVSEEK
jgi:hypothetical protein